MIFNHNHNLEKSPGGGFGLGLGLDEADVAYLHQSPFVLCKSRTLHLESAPAWATLYVEAFERNRRALTIQLAKRRVAVVP